jgi:hypothetical protein
MSRQHAGARGGEQLRQVRSFPNGNAHSKKSAEKVKEIRDLPKRRDDVPTTHNLGPTASRAAEC